MKFSDDLPLFQNLPRAELPAGETLILASASPRRAQLLSAAGYEFTVDPADDDVECGICSGQTPAEFVAKNAFLKAQDVAKRYDSGLVVGADTVAWCKGQILGKPRDEEHAEAILKMLSGKRHDVFTGVCVWSASSGNHVVDVVQTSLEMKALSDTMLASYLDSMLWEGKAGAFGYQDGNDWLSVVDGGSESNVVGLPMERLAHVIADFKSPTD